MVSVNCRWSDWGSYSSCSKTCGGGTQSFSRSKVINEANGGSCPGLSTMARNCNTENCPSGNSGNFLNYNNGSLHNGNNYDQKTSQHGAIINHIPIQGYPTTTTTTKTTTTTTTTLVSTNTTTTTTTPVPTTTKTTTPAPTTTEPPTTTETPTTTTTPSECPVPEEMPTDCVNDCWSPGVHDVDCPTGKFSLELI